MIKRRTGYRDDEKQVVMTSRMLKYGFGEILKRCALGPFICITSLKEKALFSVG